MFLWLEESPQPQQQRTELGGLHGPSLCCAVIDGSERLWKEFCFVCLRIGYIKHFFHPEISSFQSEMVSPLKFQFWPQRCLYGESQGMRVGFYSAFIMIQNPQGRGLTL